MDTTTNTFTRTHASHIAGRITTDLRHSWSRYESPSEEMLEKFRLELEELLFGHYVSEYRFGFKKSDSELVWALKYTINEDGTINNESAIAGGIPLGHNVSGANFFNFLTFSDKWHNLSATDRASIETKLPFIRTTAPLPGAGVTGWDDDKLFHAGGIAAQRSVFGAGV